MRVYQPPAAMATTAATCNGHGGSTELPAFFYSARGGVQAKCPTSNRAIIAPRSSSVMWNDIGLSPSNLHLLLPSFGARVVCTAHPIKD